MKFEDQEIIAKAQTFPRVFFKSITFNDGTVLNLKRNSIIVFTGSNNCGKSQVLRDAETALDDSAPRPVVIKDIEGDFLGEIDCPEFLEKHFQINELQYYQAIGANISHDKFSLKSMWANRKLRDGVIKVFVKRLGTELRLTVSNALQRHKNPERHPIFKLNQSEDLMQSLSNYFHQAFGVDLILNRNDMQTIPLHVGDAPDKEAYTIATQDTYYSQVAKLPQLQNQGDGMRSFVSILLDTFTSEYSITLIDEPEAFLHPPQARVLGKMLSKNNPNERQLFVSTHSEDFLQGLLDSDNENVTVIRIDRVGDVNKMSILYNNEIEKLWKNPILRYSNILGGLFHKKVVVCESDYDCLLYQSIINAMYEQKGEIAPDVLFTHCGGKHRVKDIVSALKAVNVPVVSICDFDILNSKPVFKAIAEAYGLDWDKHLQKDMKTIYDGMNAKTNAWDLIKKIGKAGFTGKEPAAYENVEAICKAIGLFIIPVGEIECFDKTINKEKKEWVYHVLENYDLAIEPKLDAARKFIQEVVDYKIAENM